MILGHSFTYKTIESLLQQKAAKYYSEFKQTSYNAICNLYTFCLL